MNNYNAIGLTIFAGLSTGIGGITVLLFKKNKCKNLIGILGFFSRINDLCIIC